MIKQWFSERDNATMCIVRAMLSAGGVAMIYTFVMHGGDYMNFGTGLASLGGAIALKNLTEK